MTTTPSVPAGETTFIPDSAGVTGRPAHRSHMAGSLDHQDGSHARKAAVPRKGEVSADHKRWSVRRLPIPWIFQRGLPRLAIIVLIGTLCAGCGRNAETVGSYRPEFLPVALNVNSSGISIEGVKSIATPIGTFSIGALYELPPRDPGSIYVILRDRRTGFDQTFEVRAGTEQFTAVVNGTTSISVTNGQVLIDITDGGIKRVTFERMSDQIPKQNKGNWLSKAWHVTIIRWLIIIIILWWIVRRLLRGY